MSVFLPQEIYLPSRNILIALWGQVHHAAPFSFQVLDERMSVCVLLSLWVCPGRMNRTPGRSNGSLCALRWTGGARGQSGQINRDLEGRNRAMMMHVIDLPAWSAWQPLQDSWRSPTIPALAGLYRIRREGQEALDYIGQTGTGTMTLQARLGMFRGIDGKEMPYRAPHTAGPALSRTAPTACPSVPGLHRAYRGINPVAQGDASVWRSACIGKCISALPRSPSGACPL